MARIRKNNCVWGLFFLSLIFVGESQVSNQFVETRNTQFVFNGSSFVFNGFNSYWMMIVAASDKSEMSKISKVFAEASEAGLNVCRTMAYYDGSNPLALQTSPGVYNENVFQALDFVVSEAGKYNIKLIMSLINNYKDLGGRPQYVQWARNAGIKITNDDDFYTNAVIRGYYMNHVKKVLTRANTITKIEYQEDPTIMAWELMNEPRSEYQNAKLLQGWIEEMAAYVKSIDKKHLLSIGMEGFYGNETPDRKQYNPGNYTVGTEFIKNHLVKEIDFTTIHAYPDNWVQGKSDKERIVFLQRWIDSHMNDSMTIVKKPLIVEEFGRNIKGNNVESRDSLMSDVYSYIYEIAKNSNGGLGGAMVWQIMSEGMESYGDGYEIVLSQSPSTTKIIRDQSTRMVALKHPVAT
ncbi:PREDICTED: mannan endo-1,4-beta-mannosidase 5-like [Lupinus angustifolius]|uniref:mannan endo-1,4-beta-mannosidase 5-like n=1 Tax=Lupinus angustifolius TaxID=3871 RepID=UPI00092F4854|nr:PREDICTED: mannan endo-1,4-beta-mannosidase 5-like [Lupinus angustifolius]